MHGAESAQLATQGAVIIDFLLPLFLPKQAMYDGIINSSWTTVRFKSDSDYNIYTEKFSSIWEVTPSYYRLQGLCLQDAKDTGYQPAQSCK